MALILIRKLGTRLNKNGNSVSWAEFLCSFCNKIVERQLSSGKICQSCGCQQYSKIVIQKRALGGIGKRKNIGENNPMYGKKGEEHPAYGLHRFGENAPNWQNGISFLPYPPEFNKELKQFILGRDNYTCQCPDCEHIINNLDIHHIDYDKNNNSSENLITLCDSCHGKTKGKKKRVYFIKFYNNLINERMI